MTGLQFVLAALVGGFSTTVRVGPATLSPLGDAFYPVVQGMAGMSTTGRVLRPIEVFFIPVPPGTEPVLDYRVEAVSSTGWDGIPWAFVPSLTGTGIETTEVNASARSVEPSEPVAMSVIPLAGTTVAMVIVDPFCYGDLSRYASTISFELTWPSRAGSRPLRGSLLDGVAPAGTVWWRDRGRSSESPFWGMPWARIKVNETGFHAITGAQLSAAGCPAVGMASASLSMLSGPAVPFDLDDPSDEHLPLPVALSVRDGGDGVFDSADTLFFYGRALVRAEFQEDTLFHTWHRYDDANTYWLTWGGPPGERMETSEAPYQGYPSWGPTAGDLVWLEQEYSWSANEDRTGWCWAPIPEGSPSYIHFTAPAGSTARSLRLSILHGNTGYGGDSIVLNDETIIDSTFINNTFIRLWTVSNPPLNPDMNTLRIWSWNDNWVSAFNYLELELESPVTTGRQLFFLNRPAGTYTIEVPGVEPGARAFLTGSPFVPTELTGWEASGGTARISITTGQSGSMWIVNPGEILTPASIEYAQPGRIVGTGLQGDVIVLLPESFMEFSAPIGAFYAARGLTIAAASYREVYDEFNQGVESPGAVRSMVRHALDNWVNPPQSLLLIGDSNHDPLGYTTGERPIAPLFRTVGPSQYKLGAGDDGFVTVHEGAVFPEIPVSRIPVSNALEMQAYLDKLAAYESALNSGTWANRVVLAADDEWNGNIDLGGRRNPCSRVPCRLGDIVFARAFQTVSR